LGGGKREVGGAESGRWKVEWKVEGGDERWEAGVGTVDGGRWTVEARR